MFDGYLSMCRLANPFRYLIEKMTAFIFPAVDHFFYFHNGTLFLSFRSALVAFNSSFIHVFHTEFSLL